jgi:hypothetical protein
MVWDAALVGFCVAKVLSPNLAVSSSPVHFLLFASGLAKSEGIQAMCELVLQVAPL